MEEEGREGEGPILGRQAARANRGTPCKAKLRPGLHGCPTEPEQGGTAASLGSAAAVPSQLSMNRPLHPSHDAGESTPNPADSPHLCSEIEESSAELRLFPLDFSRQRTASAGVAHLPGIRRGTDGKDLFPRRKDFFPAENLLRSPAGFQRPPVREEYSSSASMFRPRHGLRSRFRPFRHTYDIGPYGIRRNDSTTG